MRKECGWRYDQPYSFIIHKYDFSFHDTTMTQVISILDIIGGNAK